MRLSRLKLKHFRGIEDVDIHFNHKGITVIEGPNEIGKSSLLESIQLLFKFNDNSHSSAIKAIKPVNKDVGAEIELTADSGPYSFSYFKRYHKKSETTLTISKPQPENLTGREAHDKANKIIEETVDINLWGALNINQGEELKQAEFKNLYPLLEALDKAAGGRTTSPEEESLFELIRKEYGIYYTDNNKEKKPLQEAKNRKKEVEDEVNLISDKLKDLDLYLEKIPYLKMELQKNYEQLNSLNNNISQATISLDKITNLEGKLDSLKLALVSTNNSLNEVKNLKKNRNELSQKIDEIKLEIQNNQQEQHKLNESYEHIQTKYDDEKNQLNNIEKSYEETEKRLDICRGDYQYLQDKLFLETMNERKANIDKARENAASAELILNKHIIDKKGLDKILLAAKKLNDVQVRSNIKLPKLHIHGLSKISINLNNEDIALDNESKLSYSIDRNFEINLHEQLNINISPGQSSDEILNELENANNELSAICKSYGVSNTEEAQNSYDVRLKAGNQIKEKNEIEKLNLRDLTYEKLEDKIRNLSTSTQSYKQNRQSTTKIPGSTNESKQQLQKTQDEYDDIRKRKSSLEIQFKSTSISQNDIQNKLREIEIKSELKSSDCENLEKKLLNEREDISDEELDSRIDSLNKEVNELNTKIKDAELSLKDLGAESIRDKLDTYTKSLQKIEAKIRDFETKLTEAKTRIQIMGEEGLQDKLDAAKTKYEQYELELKNLTRKAEAARLLYTVISEERDKAKQSYIKPFKTNIEKLGKLLFNNSFEVQISEDLEVINRTLNGTTIPFNDLSGGTKEQLSLISRLACAKIIGKESGAPIILDDALGYTDPIRLQSMGVILAQAGKTCQIVILTCMPDRYSFVGDAKFINMQNKYHPS